MFFFYTFIYTHQLVLGISLTRCSRGDEAGRGDHTISRKWVGGGGGEGLSHNTSMWSLQVVQTVVTTQPNKGALPCGHITITNMYIYRHKLPCIIYVYVHVP